MRGFNMKKYLEALPTPSPMTVLDFLSLVTPEKNIKIQRSANKIYWEGSAKFVPKDLLKVKITDISVDTSYINRYDKEQIIRLFVEKCEAYEQEYFTDSLNVSIIQFLSIATSPAMQIRVKSSNSVQYYFGKALYLPKDLYDAKLIDFIFYESIERDEVLLFVEKNDEYEQRNQIKRLALINKHYNYDGSPKNNKLNFAEEIDDI